MIWKISGRGNLRRGKVWSGNSPFGEMSVGRVFIEEVPVGGLLLAKCQSGNCQVKELSYNREILTILWAISLENMFPYLFYFAPGDLRKELFIGPFLKCFKADTLRRFH